MLQQLKGAELLLIDTLERWFFRPPAECLGVNPTSSGTSCQSPKVVAAGSDLNCPIKLCDRGRALIGNLERPQSQVSSISAINVIVFPVLFSWVGQVVSFIRIE
jgi:hypothetical protein